jgi:hypothetical protein
MPCSQLDKEARMPLHVRSIHRRLFPASRANVTYGNWNPRLLPVEFAEDKMSVDPLGDSEPEELNSLFDNFG